MPYLIDGYNFIYCDERLDDIIEKHDLAAGRATLVTLLANFRRTIKDEVVVVFDGGKAGAMYPRRQFQDGIRIIYSEPESDADTVIVELLEGVGDARGFTVVTSDKQIRFRSKDRGAKVLSIDEFRALLNRKLHPKRKREDGDDLPREKLEGPNASEITFWMKVFGIEE